MIVIEQKVYRAVSGARVTDTDVAAIGPAIEALAQQNNNTITAEEILEAARSVDSPLHSYFEWDTAKAAYQYNLSQARYLARSYRVEIVTSTRDEQTKFLMRGIVNVQVTAERRAYTLIENVLDSPALLAQEMAKAKAQAQYWKDRYAQYRKSEQFQDLEPLFNVIEQITAE